MKQLYTISLQFTRMTEDGSKTLECCTLYESQSFEASCIAFEEIRSKQQASVPLIVRQQEYDPQAQDFRLCAQCGTLCLPFPTKTSGICSWCWYQSSHAHEAVYD